VLDPTLGQGIHERYPFPKPIHHWDRHRVGPYAEDPAYDVVRVDVLDGQDVHLLSYIDRPVHGILAAPPCTDFSTAQGVRSWGKKGTKAVIEGMSVVD
jgi:site-specific DNA-cytosine methylase